MSFVTGNRKLLRYIALSFLIAALACASPAGALAKGKGKAPAPSDESGAPDNHARGAALIDVSSGRLLYSKQGDERMKIASLTKIMTAIVAIEHGKLDDEVNVSVRAAGKEGSSLYLKAGEKMTLRNLLYGLMLRSGNDAAVAIAEHVGGSIEGFAFLMNKKAEEIGLANSSFVNPHGLDNPEHYSSPNDMAKLTAYALHNAVFKNIVSTKAKSAPNPHEAWDYKWMNKNRMLERYDGADGVKTGYTKQALRCLVSSATRGGQQLAAVTLNDGDDWADHAKLLDYGFAKFPLQSVVNAGEDVAGYPYKASGSFKYPFAKGERERMEVRLAELREPSAAYSLGYRGKLNFVLDSKVIGTVPLVSSAPLESSEAEASGTAADANAAARGSFGSSFRATLRALFLTGGG